MTCYPFELKKIITIIWLITLLLLLLRNKKPDILIRILSFVFRFYLLIHISIKDRAVVFARMKTVVVFYALLRLQAISRWGTVCTDICLFHVSRHLTNLNHSPNTTWKKKFIKYTSSICALYICCMMVWETHVHVPCICICTIHEN